MTRKAFNDLLLDAVDSGLASLGESAKQSIYFHLEKRYGIPRSQIPGRVEEFDRGLEEIFGAGARFLEVLIMKKLYEEMGSKGKILKLNRGKRFRFVSYVKAVAQVYQRGSGT